MIYYPRCFFVINSKTIFLTNTLCKTFRKVDDLWQQIQAQEKETPVLPEIQQEIQLKLQTEEENQLPGKI